MNNLNRVPVGTEKKEWLEMSATVSWVLWNLDKNNVIQSQEIKKIKWMYEATEFRAYVRYTLRELKKEGIKIDIMPEFASIKEAEEIWKVKTARIAWFFWLQHKRIFENKNSEQALLEWDSNAPEYRSYIRMVFNKLYLQEIRISK
jgi:hypothetical protein